MYVSNEQLFTYVSYLLHKAESNIAVDASFWPDICAKCNVQAYNWITQALTARGFGAQTQVPLWDAGADYQKSIGAFLSFTDGGILGAFDDKFLEKLDLREKLKTVQFTIAGVWQAPDGTTILETGVGRVAADFIPHGPGGFGVAGDPGSYHW